MRLDPSVPHDQYHADDVGLDTPTLSSSIAHTILTRSPLHAFHAHPKLGGGERGTPTEAMDRGALMHAMMLGSGPSLVRVEADDWRTKAAKEARDAARAAGCIAVLAEKLDDATALTDRLSKILVDRWGIDLDGESEVTALWQEGATWCRGRLDHFAGAVIYDLKFTESAVPDAFARSAYNLGADIQAAAYTSAVEAVHPELAGRVTFKWIAIEADPDVVQVYTPSGAMRELGQRRWKRAVDIWTTCLEAKRWPSYSAVEMPIEPPAWALASDLTSQMGAMAGGSVGLGF